MSECLLEEWSSYLLFLLWHLMLVFPLNSPICILRLLLFEVHSVLFTGINLCSFNRCSVCLSHCVLEKASVSPLVCTVLIAK